MTVGRGEERICPECGLSASDRQQFCRKCGFEFPPEAIAEERNLRAVVSEKGTGSCLAGAFRIIMVLALLATVVRYSLLFPRRRSHGDGREKACYANMRVLLGAIEMYNMDSAVMQKTLDEPFIKKLTSAQYLKGGISKPEPGCSYISTGDLTDTGRVRCVIHGTVESDIDRK